MRGSALFLITALMLVACSDEAREADSRGWYLSLGDSVAAGNGASNPELTSFAAFLARDRGLDLVNLAEAGATTAEVIEEQLPPIDVAHAYARLELITLSAGGNDLAGLIPNAACQEEPLPAACPLDVALAEIDQRLDTIVSRLRAAYPDTTIVLLAYPNFFSGTGHVFEAPAARVLPRLGDVLRDVASRYERVVVAQPSFEGRGGELTHVLDEQFDPHPNDQGHQIIADTIADAAEASR